MRWIAPPAFQELAPLELLKFGRMAYDFLFYVDMVVQLPRILWGMLKTHHLRRLRPEDFAFSPHQTVAVCTRAVWLAYNMVGVFIVPLTVPPIPNAFRAAIQQGKMKMVWKGTLPSAP